MNLWELLFETRIVFFRVATLFVAIPIWMFFYKRIHILTLSAFMTIYLFLCQEWSWQIGISLRWGLATPNLDWLQYQTLVPLYNLFYFTILVIILPFILKVAHKKYLLAVFLAQLSIWLLLSFASPNIYFSDDGYAFMLKKIVVDNWTKLTILVYAWVIPKLVIVGCALKWRGNIDS